MSLETIKILMVDDNEDDFIIVKKMLSSVQHRRFHIDWAPDCEKALDQAGRNEHDLCLVDYRLGPTTGLEFLKKVVQTDCKASLILLTGQSDYDVDMEAMHLGAADFISKNNLEPNLLERTIRYALERKRTQEALRHREEFFREVIEKSQDGIAIIDTKAIRYLSPSVQQILGYSPEEIIRSGVAADLIHGDDLPRLKILFEKIFQTLDVVQGMNFRAKHSNGTWHLLEAVVKNSMNIKSIQGVVIHFRDVTEQKEAERTAARLASIVESSDDAIYSVSLDGVILSWNPGAERIYGFTPEEIGGRDVSRIVAPEHKDEFPRLLTTVREGNAVANFLTSHRAKDGKEILLSLTLSPIRNPIGQVARASVIARDVTDAERAKAVKEKLQAERDQLLERHQLQMERMPIACFVTDRDYGITYLNPAAEKTFGYSFSELQGKNPKNEIVAPWARAFMGEVFDKLARREWVSREAVVVENRHKDGKLIICEWYTTPFHDAEGNFMGIMGMALDITERRRAEETQSQLAAILQQSAVAIVGFDVKGRITNWNQGAENIFGYRFEEILGKPAVCLVPLEIMEETKEIWERTIKWGEACNREETLVKKNGDQVPVSITLSPIKNGTKIVGVSIIARDITTRIQMQADLKKHEEQMNMAQKMDAIGRLAGGVAHDFNNLLSVIGGNVEFLLDGMEKDNSQKEELLEVQKAVRQGAELTKQLLVFGQKQVSQPQPVNLNDISHEMNKMLKRLIDASIDFHITQDKDLKLIQSDPGQIQQVILNLVLNARDAMPKGGTLKIETKNVEAGELTDGKKDYVESGTYVQLTVTDTGTGMTPEIQKRIFEPFFTTKEGKGTGLGLATVYAIVKKWEGSISVQSTLGAGTTFHLVFPALQHAAEVKSKLTQETLIPVGSETLLVAEDEEPLRKILVRALEKFGYKILQVGNGAEGLQKSLDYQGKIDLLLTDTIMPKMNGKELADLLKNSRPKIKIIFISGYTREVLSQQGILDSDIHLIQKPFELDFLARQVRKVLDEK